MAMSAGPIRKCPRTTSLRRIERSSASVAWKRSSRSIRASTRRLSTGTRSKQRANAARERSGNIPGRHLEKSLMISMSNVGVVRSEGGRICRDFNKLPRQMKGLGAFQGYECFSEWTRRTTTASRPIAVHGHGRLAVAHSSRFRSKLRSTTPLSSAAPETC